MDQKNKVALISVSNKDGILEFASQLDKRGWRIVSTGGTARLLEEGGLSVTKVSELTGFPEILGGRVKSLHPRIHGGILARRHLSEDQQDLDKQGIECIDMVVTNLYPFVETISREGVNWEEAVENIDIGGPAMVRAAAKNFRDVVVLVNPKSYEKVLEELDTSGDVSFATRSKLSAEAFAHTAEYDSFITQYLYTLQEEENAFPDSVILPFRKSQELRYGENPQQKAAFYKRAAAPEGTVATAYKLQGKELSFNNINDLDAAWELVKEFDETAVVAVKHANPCGVGMAKTVLDSYQKAYEADPVSIFGGIVAVNREIDAATANLMKEIFLEVVVAPSFEKEALEIFEAKPDVRLLTIPLPNDKNQLEAWDYKKISGGMLIQEIDGGSAYPEESEVVTERAPTEEEIRALAFNQMVVKHVKSNAIVVGTSQQTLGVGAGQMNRIGSARIALEHAGEKARGAVLASDAFFPFSDTVEEAARAGVTAIIQPGGSLKDQESIDACNRHGIAMVFTRRRHFKH